MWCLKHKLTGTMLHETWYSKPYCIGSFTLQILLRIVYEKMHHHHLYQQEIDFRNECIKLSSTTPTELKELPKRIPKDAARYHFFLYKHSHEGDYLESTGKDNTLKHYEKRLRITACFFNTLILYHTIIILLDLLLFIIVLCYLNVITMW